MSSVASVSILLGTRPTVRSLALNLVEPPFHPTHCSTSAQAFDALINQRFDLIFCTLQFDGSRMLDFLREVKADQRTSSIPFVAAKLTKSALRDSTVEDAMKAAKLLGAADTINFAAWVEERGFDLAREQLINRLRQLT